MKQSSLDKLLRICWEEIATDDLGSSSQERVCRVHQCAQQYNGKWYISKWGCDTLQNMMDLLKGEDNEKSE